MQGQYDGEDLVPVIVGLEGTGKQGAQASPYQAHALHHANTKSAALAATNLPMRTNDNITELLLVIFFFFFF